MFSILIAFVAPSLGTRPHPFLHPQEATWQDVDLNGILHAELSCCPAHTNAQDCGDEEGAGAECVWLDPSDPIDNAILTTYGNQCVGSGFYECKRADIDGCCGPCCECPKGEVPNPNDPGSWGPEPPYSSLCTVTPSVPTPEPTDRPTEDLSSPVVQDLPEANGVDAIINAGIEPGCRSNSNSCWEATPRNADYSTVSVSLTNIAKDSEGYCCYSYNSVKTDNLDCRGKNPDQSHLTMSIDCPEDDYILKDTPYVVAYHTDKSTCMNGIKIEHSCDSGDKSCDYDICVKYLNLDADAECQTTYGYVVNKAANTYSMMSIPVGTCNGVGVDSSLKYVEPNQFVGKNQTSSVVMQAVLALILVVGLVAYALRKCCSSGDYDKLGKLNTPNQGGYTTFV